MKVTPLALPDVCLIEPQVIGDARGFFICTWNEAEFSDAVGDVTFVQDNTSRSRQWTLRGLHFQGQHTQGKLVRCAAGRIWDVAVDVRESSPTFGRWVGAELSSETHRQLWIPPGFAHGFVVLSEFADTQYKVTDCYHPASERTLQWNDPALNISWPIPAGTDPLLSAKDASGTPFAELDYLP